MTETCVLCRNAADTSPLITVVLGVSDREWPVPMHEACLHALLAAEVAPLSSERRAPMPSDARCGVCGGRLPIVGRHPYFLSTGDEHAERTWFIHAHCLPEELVGP